MNDDDAETRVVALERQLLESQTRRSEATVAAMLSDEFVEFGSSGQVFDRDAIIASLGAETPAALRATQFEARRLAADWMLLTYRCERNADPPVRTLRSSLWTFREGRWQMVFHQGTRTDRRT